MEKIISLLTNLQKRLERSSVLIDDEILVDTSNKLNLYLSKYFKNNSGQYSELLKQVKLRPETSREKENSISSLKSIITTILEDIELSNSDFSIISEEEKNNILNNLRQQSEIERKQLDSEVTKIRELNEEMKVKQVEIANFENELFEQRKKLELETHNLEKMLREERSKLLEQEKKANDEIRLQKQKLLEQEKKVNEERQLQQQRLLEQEKKANEERKIQQQLLIDQEKKFNSFKTKLEIADKNFDFQSNALKNKKVALIWAFIALTFTILLIILLCFNITDSLSLISITNSIKKGIVTDNTYNNEIVTYAIYIGYIKYLISRFLIYSMIIYAIVFSVKNYNAQMHNHIVNTHKSNAFKSTLSLLNTARSDDGNDKLLIQATQAIFSHQQSGYSGKDSEPNNPNLITNVVETISKKI